MLKNKNPLQSANETLFRESAKSAGDVVSTGSTTEPFSKLRVAVIGTVGVPACYGGFESLVDNLLDFTPPNVEYTVFCSAKKYETHLETYKGSKLVYLDRDANGKDSILYDFESMKMALRAPVNADILLVLGVSGCVFLPYIRRIFKGKIITNIDGLEWRRDKWNFLAKKFLKLSEKMAVKYSDIVIGDNKGITDYVKDEYNKDAVLIAYGGDQVSRVEDDSLFEKYPFLKANVVIEPSRNDLVNDEKVVSSASTTAKQNLRTSANETLFRKSAGNFFIPYSVTVCRIEPENNIHIILGAFSKLPNHMLLIVGNWNKSDYGKSLKEKYSAFQNIHLLDPIYEPHTINWLRSNAALYIHGHSAGGTNPSLVEAMNLGLPILAFDCVYNRATTEEKCLYWKNAEELEKLVVEALETTAKQNLRPSAESAGGSLRSKIARDMQEAGKRLYTWKTIADKYNELY